MPGITSQEPDINAVYTINLCNFVVPMCSVW